MNKLRRMIATLLLGGLLAACSVGGNSISQQATYDASPSVLSIVAGSERVRLEPHHMYDIGWLLMETAVATRFTTELQGSEKSKEHYNPQKLLTRAKDIWQDITLNPRNDVLLRSRAQLAMGSVEPYRVLIDNDDAVNLAPYYDTQVESATILLNAYNRFGGPDLLHELHKQTAMLLLNTYATETESILLPVTSRVQEEGNDLSWDALVWMTGRKEKQFYRLRVAAREGGAIAGNIVLPPALLRNADYPSARGQGTLQALLELHLQKNPRRRHDRVRHLNDVKSHLWAEITDQTAEGAAAAFEVDAMTGLEAAKQWYNELPPNYQFKASDQERLEQCINPFEIALGGGEATADDLHTLGWLWAELNLITNQPGGFERAEEVFGLAAEQAEIDKNWPLYCESMIAKATALLYKELQTGNVDVATYRDNLAMIAEGMIKGMTTTETTSPQAAGLQATLQRLTACLIVCGDTEGDYIPVATSPQQRAATSGRVGSDLYLLSPSNGIYNPNRAGKLRFDTTHSPQTLNEGIATMHPGNLVLDTPTTLQAVVHALYELDEDEADAKANQAFIEWARTQMITIAAPTMEL